MNRLYLNQQDNLLYCYIFRIFEFLVCLLILMIVVLGIKLDLGGFLLIFDSKIECKNSKMLRPPKLLMALKYTECHQSCL